MPEFLSPEQDDDFKEGKRIPVRIAFDKDSIPEGIVLNITVSSDRQGTLLELTPEDDLEFHLTGLKPGEHVITVAVSDGTDEVEETISVIVKMEEDSLGLGPVVALAAVVLAGLAVGRRR